MTHVAGAVLTTLAPVSDGPLYWVFGSLGADCDSVCGEHPPLWAVRRKLGAGRTWGACDEGAWPVSDDAFSQLQKQIYHAEPNQNLQFMCRSTHHGGLPYAPSSDEGSCGWRVGARKPAAARCAVPAAANARRLCPCNSALQPTSTTTTVLVHSSEDEEAGPTPLKKKAIIGGVVGGALGIAAAGLLGGLLGALTTTAPPEMISTTSAVSPARSIAIGVRAQAAASKTAPGAYWGAGVGDTRRTHATPAARPHPAPGQAEHTSEALQAAPSMLRGGLASGMDGLKGVASSFEGHGFPLWWTGLSVSLVVALVCSFLCIRVQGNPDPEDQLKRRASGRHYRRTSDGDASPSSSVPGASPTSAWDSPRSSLSLYREDSAARELSAALDGSSSDGRDDGRFCAWLQ
jgi:hypothetical protein